MGKKHFHLEMTCHYSPYDGLRRKYFTGIIDCSKGNV